MGWLLVIGLKKSLLECATACIKSEVILIHSMKYVTLKSKCYTFIFQKTMEILYKLFQEHQMMLLSSTTTTTPLPLPNGPDVQCGQSWKNDTLGKVKIDLLRIVHSHEIIVQKKWYFVSKMVLTYFEKKHFVVIIEAEGQEFVKKN